MKGTARINTTGAPDMITSGMRREVTPQCEAVMNWIRTKNSAPSMNVATVKRAKR